MKAALRTFAFGVLAFVLSFFAWYGAFLAIPLDWHRGRAFRFFERLWGRSILVAAGVRVILRNPERFAPDEARVIVANHASYLDLPALMWAFPGPMRIVAKEALRRMPFVGWHLQLSRHFFLDRADPRQALALMEKASARMRKHRISALLFPEGTRSADGRLGPLKPGAFFLPLAAGAAIQPVAVLGSHDVMPKGAFGPRRAGTIELRVGEPISVEGRAGAPARKALAVEVRAALLALGVPASEPEGGAPSA